MKKFPKIPIYYSDRYFNFKKGKFILEVCTSKNNTLKFMKLIYPKNNTGLVQLIENSMYEKTNVANKTIVTFIPNNIHIVEDVLKVFETKSKLRINLKDNATLTCKYTLQLEAGAIIIRFIDCTLDYKQVYCNLDSRVIVKKLESILNTYRMHELVSKSEKYVYLELKNNRLRLKLSLPTAEMVLVRPLTTALKLTFG